MKDFFKLILRNTVCVCFSGCPIIVDIMECGHWCDITVLFFYDKIILLLFKKYVKNINVELEFFL